MDVFLTTAKPLCESGDNVKLFEVINSNGNRKLLEDNVLALENVARTLDSSIHTQLISVFLSLVSTPSPEQSPTILSTSAAFLLACNASGLRASGSYATSLCRNMVTIASKSDQAQVKLMSILRALGVAVEKFRSSPDVLTPIHSEYLRACLKAKAYHLPVSLLNQPIYDLCGPSVGFYGPMAPVRESNGVYNCGITPEEYLAFWFYGALIWIGLKEFLKAQNMLLMALICPSQSLSTIQADAYKKYVLVGLILSSRVDHSGKIPELPKYTSSCMHRLSKHGAYDLQPQGDFIKLLEAKTEDLTRDRNFGLAKQVIATLKRRKISVLTRTYLTLSIDEIRTKVSDQWETVDVEGLLFEMVGRREIIAKLDESNGTVSFEETDDAADAQDVHVGAKLEEHLTEILELTRRIADNASDLFDNNKVESAANEAMAELDPDRMADYAIDGLESSMDL